MKFLFVLVTLVVLSQAEKSDGLSDEEYNWNTLEERRDVVKELRETLRIISLINNENRVRRQAPSLNYEVELDKILENDRLVDHYFKCLVDDKYRCRGDGLKLKKRLPQALREGLELDPKDPKNCEHCGESEKRATVKLMHFLLVERPDMWKKIEKKYDPTGAYKKKYAEKYGTELQKNKEVLEEAGITLPPEVAAPLPSPVE